METLYSTYVSIEKAIHNKRALIVNHEDTIEWARINRARIDAAKEKTKENKKTKAQTLLHKQIANSEKEVEKLSAISSKLKNAGKAADSVRVNNAILTTNQNFETKKRKLELELDTAKKDETDKCRKIILESRYRMNLMHLAHENFVRTSIIKGDIQENDSILTEYDFDSDE